jgi:ankyrin repeat protein
MENNETVNARHDPCEEDASILNAVENGDIALMMVLLSSSPAGQSAQIILKRIGSHALQIACQHGHLDIVEWLLKSGDVDVHSDYDSALQWAARRGDSELVHILLRNGADPTVLNGVPLRIALNMGHNDVARLLMEHVSTLQNKNHLDGMKLV